MGSGDSGKLTKKIMLGLFLGLIAGMALFYTGNQHLAEYLRPIGDVFLKLLKMCIVPLVLSSMFMAIVNLGSPQKLGNLGLRSIIYYFSTTAVAAFIGLVLVNIIQPGIGVDLSGLLTQGSMDQALTTKLNSSAETGLFKTILGVLIDAVPSNPFESLSKATILQVIVASLLFGSVALFKAKECEPVVKFMGALETISMTLVHWIMYLAPYGVFALMAVVLATSGFEALQGLAWYMVTVLIGLLIHFIILLVIGSVRSKKSPLAILKATMAPVLTAFSTSSSASTLPITMAAVEDDLGVKKDTAQFVLPLGATINMDGTALYESVAVIFIGQAYGLAMPIGTQVVIFLTASLAAIGAAAIPGAGLVTMSIVLSAVGFPLEGIGLILAVDRVLDMFRTSVNVFGDCMGTLVVESFEKKKT